MKILDKKNLSQILMLLVWVCISGYTIFYHVMWRDEVRNFMISINGSDSIKLIGNSHPVVIYLMQKVGYFLTGSYYVAPVLAFLIALTAVSIFIFCAPFSLFFKALFVFGYPALYEYTVMARGYGISMLLMFVLALVFSSEKYRYRLTGPTLFVLANTNAHSALIAAIFSVMWPVCTWKENRWKLNAAVYKTFPTAAMGLAGFVACILTIYPPRYDDLAAHPMVREGAHHLKILFLKELTFSPFKTEFLESFGQNFISHLTYKSLTIVSFIATMTCIFAVWGNFFLFATALVTEAVFITFFSVVYPGDYRHQILLLVLICSLFWIFKKTTTRKPTVLNKIGVFSLSFLLFTQVVHAALLDFHEVHEPNSRSKEFANLVQSQPDLRDAAIIATSDDVLESMPYYMSNKLYVMTQKKFDRVVPFTARSYKNYSLSDVLDTAKTIAACTAKPVIILVVNENKKDSNEAPRNIMDHIQDENYRYYGFGYWKFTFSEQQKNDLKAQTTEIAHYPNGFLEEGFVVYRLNPSLQALGNGLDCAHYGAGRAP